MKQALLITAYRDEANLIRLLRHFSDGNAVDHFRIFVHIDKKSQDLDVDRILSLKIPNVQVVSLYSVCWGSIRHVYAVLDLMRMALRCDDVSYVHVLSGSDIAVQPASWFVERFASDHETRLNAGMFRMLDRGNKFDWYCRYWLPSTWNHRNRFVFLANLALQKIQKLFGVTRCHLGGISREDIWYSHIWASYSSEACRHILEFAETHQPFLKALNLTMVPEEVFFATAIAGTKYESKSSVPYLRYANWDLSRGAVPAVLDKRDYKEISLGKYAFARKVDTEKSAELLLLIDADLKYRLKDL